MVVVCFLVLVVVVIFAVACLELNACADAQRTIAVTAIKPIIN